MTSFQVGELIVVLSLDDRREYLGEPRQWGDTYEVCSFFVRSPDAGIWSGERRVWGEEKTETDSLL